MKFWENKKFIPINNPNTEKYNGGYFYPFKGQPFLLKQDNQIFLYYENYDNNKNWEIGVSIININNFPYGQWGNYSKILCGSRIEGHPDKDEIADPVVIYYENKYHMWFDMRNKNTTWTIGHATSKDGIHWVKQQTNGKTDILLSPSENDWDNSFVHAPEVFYYNNQLSFIYNAVPQIASKELQGDYSAGLMKLSDPNNLNSPFIKLGKITYPNSPSIVRPSRLFAPFWYKENLYAVLSCLKEETITNYPDYFYFVNSKDGGKTWEDAGQLPNNLWFHSFLLHNGKLWAFNQLDQKIYYLEE